MLGNVISSPGYPYAHLTTRCSPSNLKRSSSQSDWVLPWQSTNHRVKQSQTLVCTFLSRYSLMASYMLRCLEPVRGRTLRFSRNRLMLLRKTTNLKKARRVIGMGRRKQKRKRRNMSQLVMVHLRKILYIRRFLHHSCECLKTSTVSANLTCTMEWRLALDCPWDLYALDSIDPSIGPMRLAPVQCSVPCFSQHRI